MTWKTYLIMYFGTEGNSTMSETVKKVEEMGFQSALGPADFIYEWDQEPSKEQVFELGNKLLEILKGTNTVFNLETHN
jgi:hypothetical protein